MQQAHDRQWNRHQIIPEGPEKVLFYRAEGFTGNRQGLRQVLRRLAGPLAAPPPPPPLPPAAAPEAGGAAPAPAASPAIAQPPLFLCAMLAPYQRLPRAAAALLSAPAASPQIVQRMHRAMALPDAEFAAVSDGFGQPALGLAHRLGQVAGLRGARCNRS
jgi:hypothetical protein